MSEGPEVRRVARRLDRALGGAELPRIETRLKKARAWLDQHPGRFDRACFECVESRGKHLLFRLVLPAGPGCPERATGGGRGTAAGAQY